MAAATQTHPRLDDQDVFDMSEVAAIIRQPRANLYRMFARGELESIKIGKYRLCTAAQLRRFLARKEAESKSKRR